MTQREEYQVWLNARRDEIADEMRALGPDVVVTSTQPEPERP